jgi:putative ATPase
MPTQRRPANRAARPPAQTALFAPQDEVDAVAAGAPLAARMRPRTLDEYVGQEHLVGPGKILRRLIEAGQLPSIILWGPPGSGKTTLARLIASMSQANFVGLSAVSAGVADLRRIVAEAETRKRLPSLAATRPEALEGRLASGPPSPSTERGLGGEVSGGTGAEPLPRGTGGVPQTPSKTPAEQTDRDAQPHDPSTSQTILFIDEIHRFNKAQQDAVLPYVEDGTVTLIGATTENPSFEVIGPLLSRSRVFVLKALDEAQIAALVRRAISDPERGLGALNVEMDDEAIEALAASVGGDARIALNALEAAVMSVAPSQASDSGPPSPWTERGPGGEVGSPSARPEALEGRRLVTRAIVEEALQHRTYLYDRQGDAHYDTISAFIKSLRGSDPDASLYWLARMIEAGEDPLFIVRRMVILAAEDVGLADPQALVVATACQQAVHFIGMPEGFLPMAEAALYLALAPKSNSALTAYQRALADVQNTRNDPVPLHLRNAPTGLMHSLGYGKGYEYAHDYDTGIAPGQTYLPERLQGHHYYIPRNLGQEKDIASTGLQDPDFGSEKS